MANRELTKEEITDLMLSEMLENDLTYVQFHWDAATHRHGATHWEKFKAFGTGEEKCRVTKITLSEPIFNALRDKWSMVNTVYHELAHAIAIRDYGSSKHCDNWREIAIELGASPNRCSSDPIEVEKINYKYTATCISCGYVGHFSRLGKNWRNGAYVHKNCGGEYDITKNY